MTGLAAHFRSHVRGCVQDRCPQNMPTSTVLFPTLGADFCLLHLPRHFMQSDVHLGLPGPLQFSTVYNCSPYRSEHWLMLRMSNACSYAFVSVMIQETPLTSPCLPLSSPSSVTRLQSFTPPFQSAIRPCFTSTRTTRTSSPSM